MDKKGNHVAWDKGFDVRHALRKGSIAAWFPLHDKTRLEILERDWTWNWGRLPWNQPYDEIRSYFGEKIALYFCFTGHYVFWLLFPALIGLIPFGFAANSHFAEEAYDSWVHGVFGFLIALWGIVMLEAWKRRQAKAAFEWGMTGFEEQETDRPEFEGEPALSLTGGDYVLMSNEKWDNIKRGSSAVAISFMISIVIALVAAIFFFRIIMLKSKQYAASAPTIASILNSIQIQVMNALYSRLALYLTKKENHRTDTQYQDALIAKLFAFQFVNSFSSLAYLAFVMPYTGQCGDTCMAQLANNLIIILAIRCGTNIISNVALPYFMHLRKSKADVNRTALEDEFKVRPAASHFGEAHRSFCSLFHIP